MKIRRFYFTKESDWVRNVRREDKDGPWCRYEDVEPLLERIKELEAARERQCDCTDWEDEEGKVKIREWFDEQGFLYVITEDKMENSMKRYAVMIDVDGDWMYVPENTMGFLNHPKPKLFSVKAKAEEEATRWNTGVVVDYDTKHILPFTQEERQAAAKRAKRNQ